MLLLAAATENELRAALAGLGAPRAEHPEEGGAFEPSAGVLAVACGVGVVNTALTLSATLERHPVTGVVLLGVCGSYDLETLPMGAACVATSEAWPEYGLGTEERPGVYCVDAAALKFPVHEGEGETIWNRMELAPERAAERMQLTLPEEWARAEGITVSTVSGTAGRAAALVDGFSLSGRPAMESMEGFAAALACRRAGIPFLEVRTVSNMVGSRAAEHWNLRQALTSLTETVKTLLTTNPPAPIQLFSTAPGS